MIRYYFLVFFVYCGLASLVSGMPHWRLFEYKIDFSFSHDTCNAEIFSVFKFLNITSSVTSDKFYGLKVETEVDETSSRAQANIVCGEKEKQIELYVEYIYNEYEESFVLSKISEVSFYNDDIFNKNNIEGFYIINRRVFLNCNSIYEIVNLGIEKVKFYDFRDNFLSDNMSIEASCFGRKTYTYFN
jgi:hypothetical protein